MLLKQLLLPNALLILPLTLSAQTVTDPTRATAARDSLFNQATQVRQQVEQKSTQPPTKAPRNGAYRIIVKGYYVPSAGTKGSSTLAWKHTIIYRYGGTRLELYTAYSDKGKVLLQERRNNGELTWLKVQNYQTPALTSVSFPTWRSSGSYAAKNYVWWNGQSYLLTSRLVKP
ncbi:hypothetical protein [Hymenobacter crusticola]|uniref:Uncharacterized protein n=1 Tax=Hymenobacter crusticola TaxID=1770526 RepID=A0A243WK74_9BACT|nr:hypothetical protein [Hymenobacter crusticola]OUJ76266.1 hypothetical protein BXP70_03140 [Hymenobacter crusticola]